MWMTLIHVGIRCPIILLSLKIDDLLYASSVLLDLPASPELVGETVLTDILDLRVVRPPITVIDCLR